MAGKRLNLLRPSPSQPIGLRRGIPLEPCFFLRTTISCTSVIFSSVTEVVVDSIFSLQDTVAVSVQGESFDIAEYVTFSL